MIFRNDGDLGRREVEVADVKAFDREIIMIGKQIDLRSVEISVKKICSRKIPTVLRYYIMEQEVMGSGARHDAQTESSRAKKKNTRLGIKGKGISIAKKQTNLNKKTMKGNSARANTHIRKGKSGFKKVLKKRKKATSALTISKNKTESPYAAKVRELNEKTLAKLEKSGLFMPPPSREEVLASVLSGPDHYFQICVDMENDFVDGEEDTEFNEGLFLETPRVSSDEENSDTEDDKKQP